MRIALFTGAYNHIADGVSLTLNRLVSYLEGRGARVLVHAPVAPTPALAHSGTLVPLPSVAAPGRPEYRVSLGLPRKVKESLKSFRPSLVHIATPDWTGLQALRYGIAAGVPVVASYHTHFPSYLAYYHLAALAPFLWAYMRWFYRRCDQVYVPSESMVSLLREHGFGNNLRLWTRGVESDLFSPCRRSTRWRREHGIGEHEVVVTFVSRLVAEKGLDVLAEVIEGLESRGIKYRSVVVGDGPARPDLERRLPRTVFTGRLERNMLATAYASSDVFLFPSDTETFGNVTLEAMSSGLPTVCAAATGSQTLVREGITGYLVAPGDSQTFLDRVGRLVCDTNLRTRMSCAARAAAEQYQWDGVLARIAGYYEELG
ncbi:MAG TPA: glycosyltransferase family 1 protein [Gemmatimonadaceae bacterium]